VAAAEHMSFPESCHALIASASNVAPVITPALHFLTIRAGYELQRHFRVSVSIPNRVWTALVRPTG